MVKLVQVRNAVTTDIERSNLVDLEGKKQKYIIDIFNVIIL